MKTLRDITEVIINNNECVVLKVKENSRMDLIALGCFDGNEEMLRLTKGRNQHCTVFSKDGKIFSWSWGWSGTTLVNDSIKRKGNMIQDTIENGFGIDVQE